MPFSIKVGARPSPLSRRQVAEVEQALGIKLTPLFLQTRGDLDQATSLRTLEKSNFFTDTVDEALLQGHCQIAIHSAKDLPQPLQEGLTLVALTRGLSDRDSLVLRQGETLSPGMRIATSSKRREKAAAKLCQGLTFVDIRGPIEARIDALEKRVVDGVVIAEAALIRLNLTHLNRLPLPGATVPYQGQLAVVARTGDREMEELFAQIDVRQDHRILYLGLDPSSHHLRGKIVHTPLIEIIPRQVGPVEIDRFTHLLFTSKSAVSLFPNVGRCATVAVGSATAHALRKRGIEPILVAEEESSEGIIAALETLPLEGASLLWPHSSLSRRLIPNYLSERQIPFEEIILYDTLPRRPEELPDLSSIDEIAFTSPSTVAAFFQFYGALPEGKSIWTQGATTRCALERELLQERKISIL